MTEHYEENISLRPRSKNPLYDYCNVCVHKKWELKEGTRCGITGKKPKQITECEPAIQLVGKKSDNQFASMIREYQGAQSPWDQKPSYDFLTPPGFDWKNYSKRVDAIFIADREFNLWAVIKVMAVITGGFVFLGVIRTLNDLPVYWSAFWVLVPLAGMFLLFTRSKKILRMEQDKIVFKGREFTYQDISYVYFQSVNARTGNVVLLVFQLKDGTKLTAPLSDMGHYKEVIGPIVYTKMKMAEAARHTQQA